MIFRCRHCGAMFDYRADKEVHERDDHKEEDV